MGICVPQSVKKTRHLIRLASAMLCLLRVSGIGFISLPMFGCQQNQVLASRSSAESEPGPEAFAEPWLTTPNGRYRKVFSFVSQRCRYFDAFMRNELKTLYDPPFWPLVGWMQRIEIKSNYQRFFELEDELDFYFEVNERSYLVQATFDRKTQIIFGIFAVKLGVRNGRESDHLNGCVVEDELSENLISEDDLRILTALQMKFAGAADGIWMRDCGGLKTQH